MHIKKLTILCADEDVEHQEFQKTADSEYKLV